MKLFWLYVTILAMTLIACTAHSAPVCRNSAGAICRDRGAVHTFMRTHPCPTTGSKTTCHGYKVDHIRALCTARTEAERAALDVPSNMQWQTTVEAAAKDRWECRPGAATRVHKQFPPQSPAH